MDLELRVEQLEQEVQMLKTQIQTTLLDIQEQILNNTYPSLRAEVPTHERTEQVHPAVRTISALPSEAADYDEEDAASEPLKVRKVSLKDLNTSEPQAAQKPTYPKGVAEPMPSQSVSGHTDAGSAKPKKLPKQLSDTDIARLEEWSARDVKKHGVAATRALIRSYVENGRIPAYMEARLLTYIRSLPAATVDHTALDKAAKTAKPSNDPTSLSYRDRGFPDFMEDEEEKAGMVLRLIAGIQNASAGVKWRK